MPAVDFGTVLNALMIAGMVWQAKTILQATVTLAVHDEKHRGHDEKHKRHDERFNQLESKHAAK